MSGVTTSTLSRPPAFLCLVLAALLFAVPARADEVDRVLERELPRLADPSYRVRAEAHQALAALGYRAEDAVSAALAKTSDLEVQARLAAILQGYAIEAAEAYALRQLAKNEPFPTARAEALSVSEGDGVRSFLDTIHARTGLVWRFHPSDPALARRATETLVNGMHSFGGQADVAQRALVEALNLIEATYVVEGTEVVVVRLTPAVFFARFEHETRGYRGLFELEFQSEFAGERPNHWTTLKYFLQTRAKAGGLARLTWLEFLAAAAAPEAAGPRATALRALGCYLGMDDTPQPDVAAIVERYCDPAQESDPAVRAAALLALAMCPTPPGPARALDVLEHGPDGDRRAFLARLYHVGAMLHVLHAIDPARVRAALGAIADGAGDPDMRVLAICLLAQREPSAALADKLATWEPVPEETETRALYLHALSRAGSPACRVRLDHCVAGGPPWVRALHVQLTAGAAAGASIVADRVPDVAVATAALLDADPLVRYCAVHGLSTVYSRHAAAPCRVGLSEAREALASARAREADPRVLAAIASALDSDMQSDAGK